MEPNRRRFLECMGWAGTGLVWSVSGGVASSTLLAPATAHVMAQLLTGKGDSLDLSAFSPARNLPPV